MIAIRYTRLRACVVCIFRPPFTYLFIYLFTFLRKRSFIHPPFDERVHEPWLPSATRSIQQFSLSKFENDFELFVNICIFLFLLLLLICTGQSVKLVRKHHRSLSLRAFRKANYRARIPRIYSSTVGYYYTCFASRRYNYKLYFFFF